VAALQQFPPRFLPCEPSRYDALKIRRTDCSRAVRRVWLQNDTKRTWYAYLVKDIVGERRVGTREDRKFTILAIATHSPCRVLNAETLLSALC
jgi:hypothetical protein